MVDTLKSGEFIEFDFVGRIKISGQIFDLSVKEIAEKEKIHDHKHKYEPMRAVLGAGMLIPGLDRQIVGSEVGKEYTFEISSDEAYGPRNPKLIQLTNLNKFKEFHPVQGMQVNVDGMTATVRAVSGGRVTLDFNHPLAGKALSYWVKINRKITDVNEKIKIVLSLSKIEVKEIKEDEKEITITGENFDKLDATASKALADHIKKMIPEIKKEIVFTKG